MNRALWPILTGFCLWAIAFIALYGLQYLGCYFGWDTATHRAALIAAYGVTVALLAGLLTLQIVSMRRRKSVTAIERIGLGTSIAAFASSAIVFAPTLVISACH